MKHLLNLVILFYSTIAVAQTDFKTLAADIGDKRIVFLDELTHGEREVFHLKAKLTRYLHQHHDFDAIVLESGMFDMAQLWQSEQPITSNAPGNVFYMYANEPVFQSLLKYIDKYKTTKRPLELAGFDGRLSGEFSIAKFPMELKKQLSKCLPEIPKNFNSSLYFELINKTLTRQLSEQDSKHKLWFNQRSQELINGLLAVSSSKGYNSPAYYAHLLDGVLLIANNIWGDRRFDEHDIVMANNLDWLLQNQLKGKKVVVWGQFVHLNKRYYSTSKTDNVTSIIKKRYPNQTYVVHFAGLDGSYRDFVSGKVKTITPATSSAERYLWTMSKSKNPNFRFINPKQQSAIHANQGLTFYGLQYKEPLAAHHWHLYWDGLFVLKQVSPSS